MEKLEIENKIINLKNELTNYEGHIKNDCYGKVKLYESFRLESLILLKHYTNLLNTYNLNK